MTNREQHEEFIVIVQELQELHTKLKQLIDPNGEFFQVLAQQLKDVPDDDENAQEIVQGLRQLRELYNVTDDDIRVLQRALKEEEAE